MKLAIFLSLVTVASCAYDGRLCKVKFPDACADAQTIETCDLWEVCSPILHSATIKQVETFAPSKCDICEKVVAIVNKTASSPYFSNYVRLAAIVACYFTPEPGTCVGIINESVEIIVRLLKEGYDTKKICSVLRLCDNWVLDFDGSSDSGALTYPIETEDADDTICEMCELAVTESQAVLSNNATQQEILALLQSVCSVLPGETRSMCISLVGEYFQEAVTYFLQQDAATLCKEAGLCNQLASTSSKERTDATANDHEVCRYCEVLTTDLKALLSNQKTQSELLLFVASLCEMLPSTLRSQCTSDATAYFSKLVEYVLSHDSDALCQLMGLCSQQAATSSFAFSKASVDEATVSSSATDETCTLCEQVVTEAQTLLKDSSTQQEVRAALLEVCTLLPDSFRTQCTTYVTNYFQLVITVLLDTAPATLCKMAGLCNSNSTVTVPSGEFESFIFTNPDQCTQCTQAFTEIIEQTKGKSEVQIVAYLKALCDLAPVSDRSACLAYMTSHAKQIADMIIGGKTAEQICKALDACAQSSDALRSIYQQGADTIATQYVGMLLRGAPMQQENPAVQTESEETEDAACSPTMWTSLPGVNNACDRCIHDMKAVILAVKGKSEQQIIDYLTAWCNKVPAEFRANCTAFMKSHAKQIADMILAGKNAFEICRAIGSCESEPEQTFSFGTIDECSACQQAISLVAQEAKGKSEADIIALLIELCERVPLVDRLACKSYMQAHAKAIADMILRNETSQQICQALGACPKLATDPSADQVDRIIDDVLHVVPETETETDEQFLWTPSVKNDCDICIHDMKLVIRAVHGKSEQEIIDFLVARCDKVPAEMRANCTAFMKAHAMQIADLILAGKNAFEICKALGSCSASGSAFEGASRPIFSDNEECEICERIFEVIIDTAKDKTEPEIVKYLEAICSEFPKDKQSMCQSFMIAHAKEIADWILQGFTAQQLCIELGACSSTTGSRSFERYL